MIVSTDEAIEAIVERVLRRVMAEAPAVDWIDAKAVAAMLKIKPRSVQKMIAHQALPAHRIGAKLWRFRRTEIESWIAGPK